MRPNEKWDRDQIAHDARLLEDLRDLGGVELRRPTKRLGFERRLERADSRPRVEGAWGYPPRHYDE